MHLLAVVYVRVSTKYQIDNYSIEERRGLASLASRYGFALVEIREKFGVSPEALTDLPVMEGILEQILLSS